MHNIEIITEKKAKVVNCNCISKFECPLSNQFQIANIIYKAKITSNRQNYQGKYTTEPAQVHLNSDMETKRNYLIMKDIGQIKNVRMNFGDGFFILYICLVTY